MGHDRELFVDGDLINEELLCSICNGVFDDPVTTSCDHTFCNSCICEWLRGRSLPTCPMDRTHLQACMLKPATRVVKNIIDQLEVNCQFQEQGCRETFTLGTLKKHLGECLLNPTRLVECPNWCRQKMTKAEMDSHDCTKQLIRYYNRLENQMVKLNHDQNVLVVIIIILCILYAFLPFDRVVKLLDELWQWTLEFTYF